MARRTWALKLLDDCQAMSQQATQRYEEINGITQAVDAAVLNLEKHVKALDEKNANVQNWATEIRKEQEVVGGDWNVLFGRVQSIPAHRELIEFAIGHSLPSQHNATLQDFIDVEHTKTAVQVMTKVAKELPQDGVSVGTKVDTIMSRMDQLFDRVESSPARNMTGQVKEPANLIQDIEPLVRKVSNDYESVLSYENSPKSISQASKSALLHTKNFLPNLLKRSVEMHDILKNVSEARNEAASDAIEAMHDIASLTTLVGEANAQFATINLNAEAEEALHLVSILNSIPQNYASLLAEAVRRQEWSEKIRSDSATLANEMATFREEEEKRRRRWQKTAGADLLGNQTEAKVMDLEINVLKAEEEWPSASREDLEELIHHLQAHGSPSQMITDVSKILEELKAPTKQQTKRAKAFKAGSIHEAALGKSGLLIRGDDEIVRVLQEEKQRTESKLKSAESRIRRLEDLLHRQSHISRTSTGNMFQIPSTPISELPSAGFPPFSPRPEDMSRRSSVSSRRFSANHGAEEKSLQQKVLVLEADLVAERERASGLQGELDAGKIAKTELQGQIKQATSIKNDLMGNFEAQQREFLEERKSLENEIKRLKSKLDELEDEMDRYLGSRENEKISIDERVKALSSELDLARKEAAAEAQKAQGQVEFLRRETQLQREVQDKLERENLKLKEERKEFEGRAQTAESLVDEHYQTLVELFNRFSPTARVPVNSADLVDKLLNRASDLVRDLDVARNDVVIAQADHKNAQASFESVKSDFHRAQTELEKVRSTSVELKEDAATQRARYDALEAELDEGQQQLVLLREKIAHGETGSEALRTRLEEEERKVTAMSSDLATRFSHVGALEEELRTSKDRYRTLQAKTDTLSAQLDARSSHVKDLSQRVYVQNDRLCRLLNRLSYSVTREGGSMTIQRIPRPDRSMINANDSSDPGTNMRRSISGAIARKSMVDSGDLDLLNWMHNDDSIGEAERYASYVEKIASFDIDQFSEAITKRVKDMEYTAKKYNKDARSYREKSHIAQKEAHEKIAFKNFREGDLALFLPTRNQATGAWAAFNVGAPHYFLREQDSHKLRSRDWLLARIHRVEDRVVDLSKSMSSTKLNVSDGKSFGEASNGGDSFEDDNPFDLSDGLRWYLIDAVEEKPGAPSTPGLGKSTVASTHIDATGDIRRQKKSSSAGVEGLNKTLSKSLDSRRSSTNSKRGLPSGINGLLKSSANPGDNASLKSNSTAQVTGETSDAQIIKGKDISADKNNNAEVGYHQIDDLIGP